MEQKTIFEEAFKDFRNAIVEAQKQTRTYEKKSDYIYKPTQARFKAVIYRKDGKTRYYYSYDNKTYNKERFTDEYEGMIKLMKLIFKYNGQFKNAIIYATLDEDKATTSDYNYQVAFYDIFGNSKTNNAVTFKNVGRNSVLNLQHLKLYGKQIINK